MAHSFWYPAQWGELGGWVTGTATMLLAGVTAVGLHRERKVRQEQQGQIDEQREVMRKQSALLTAQLRTHNTAQAKKVTVQAHFLEFELIGQRRAAWRTVRVKNGSDRPIRDVQAAWVSGDQKVDAVRVGFVTDLSGLVPFQDRGDPPFAVLREGKRLDLVFPLVREESEEEEAAEKYTVTFKDDDGLVWQIDQDQNVTEAPGKEPIITEHFKLRMRWRRLKLRR